MTSMVMGQRNSGGGCCTGTAEASILVQNVKCSVQEGNVCVRREWRENETAAENELCTRDKNALEGERDPKWRAWTVGGP
jgi:hypothetical protein